MKKYINNKKYVSCDELARIFSNDYGVKVTMNDIHRLVDPYCRKRKGSLLQIDGEWFYDTATIWDLRHYGDNAVEFVQKIKALAPQQEKQTEDELEYNPNFDMDSVDKWYRPNSIKINENQYKRLFQEDFYRHQNDDGSYDVEWRNNNRIHHDDTTRYKDINGKKMMHPRVVLLPKSKINCYNLYNFGTMEINQAIKKNTWGKNGPTVNWINNSDKEFKKEAINYSVELIKYMEKRLSRNENMEIKVGYITWPQSSSQFNFDICKPIKEMLGGDIKIKSNLLLKNKRDITVNENIALELGCDADDIAELQQWALNFEYAETIKPFRRAIQQALMPKKNEFEKNGVQTKMYQFKSSKVNDNRDDKFYHDDETNTYFGGRVKTEWNGKNKNNSKVDLKRNNKNDVIMNIPSSIYSIMEKIKENYDKISDLYDKYDEKMTKIENDYKKNKNNPNYGSLLKNNTFNANAHQYDPDKKLNHHFYLNYINANDEDKDWEIKEKGEYARRILENLFVINEKDSKENNDMTQDEKQNKIIVVFDDNMAGGSTIDSCCYELEKVGWKYIIPITLATMTLSAGGDLKHQTKQKERDKRNNYKLNDRIKQNRVEKYYGYKDDNGEYTFDGDDEINNISPSDLNMSLTTTFPNQTPSRYTIQESCDWVINDDVENLLTHKKKYNNNFTQAQWNQMTTIDESKLSKSTISNIIRKQILKEIADYAPSTNVTVCSLDEFFKFCRKYGFDRNGSNVDNQNEVAFIEIGSGLPRWEAEVHHYNADAFDFDPQVENFSKTDANMMFKHQYYFLGDNKNVLKLMYDDNQEINNKTKHIGDKNFYGVDNGEDNNATCVNLSAGETNDGKKTRFYYSGAIVSSVNDYKAIKTFVDMMLSKNPNMKFIIHCRQGTSRSASIGTYVARKVAEIKNENWEEYLMKYYEDHKKPLIQGKKHQFRIGRGSKGNPSYPDGNTLAGLGELEGWNVKGKNAPKSWAHNFIRDYGDMNDMRYNF